MPDPQRLPEQFRELEPMAPIWALGTELERHQRRLTVPMAELQAFYDVMMARIDDILGYLNEFAPDKLTPEGQQLLYLMFSLAEIGPAVEIFGQPEVPGGYDSRRFIPAEGQ
ncbi:MAG: hypothetical protein ACREQT_02185 [Candidatus Binataceae bacterium]